MSNPYQTTKNNEQARIVRQKLINIYENSENNQDFYDKISHISNEELFVFIDEDTLKALKDAGSFLCKELNKYHISIISDGEYLKLPHFVDREKEVLLNQYYNLGIDRSQKKLRDLTGKSTHFIKKTFSECRFEDRVTEKLLHYQELVNLQRQDAIIRAGDIISSNMDNLISTAIHGAINGGLDPTQQKMLVELIKMGGVSAVEKMHVKHETISEGDVLAMLGITDQKKSSSKVERDFMLIEDEPLEEIEEEENDISSILEEF